MADYLQVVDNIRVFLGTPDRARTAELSELAGAYATLCREANGRLRRCIDYLRRGHRTEAIELAECEPPLLDLVTALDFSEATEWGQVCAAYDLARPGRPMMDAAREVNEAYGVEQPLAELLGRHRALALAREPLPGRLTVLRELAARDARNPAWHEDLKSLEQARLREMATEALPAIKARQIASIDRLLNEVKETDWRTPVPPELATALATASLAGHREVAEWELRQLAPMIQSVCETGDYEQARQAMKRWSAVVTGSGISVPADLREIIRPLNEIIDAEEDRRDRARKLSAACKLLLEALRTGAPQEQVRELHLAAVRFELPIPDEIESEYRRRAVEWDRDRQKESRRNLLMTAALVAVIVAALGGLVAVILITSKH